MVSEAQEWWSGRQHSLWQLLNCGTPSPQRCAWHSLYSFWRILKTHLFTLPFETSDVYFQNPPYSYGCKWFLTAFIVFLTVVIRPGILWWVINYDNNKLDLFVCSIIPIDYVTVDDLCMIILQLPSCFVYCFVLIKMILFYILRFSLKLIQF